MYEQQKVNSCRLQLYTHAQVKRLKTSLEQVSLNPLKKHNYLLEFDCISVKVHCYQKDTIKYHSKFQQGYKNRQVSKINQETISHTSTPSCSPESIHMQLKTLKTHMLFIQIITFKRYLHTNTHTVAFPLVLYQNVG